MLKANLDGFRMYKIHNRGDESGTKGRVYTAPVYVTGLPGDIDLLNKELDALQPQMDAEKARKLLKGGCCADD